MFTEQAIFFYYTETPLHAGSGSSVAYVDLPIQREKHTEYPIVQASGVKGAFRSWARDLFSDRKDEINKAFGPENSADEHGGALAFTDAQVLLFPVRSFAGGFAWITCPLVINRFLRMAKTAGIATADIDDLGGNIQDEDEKAFVATGNASIIVNPGGAHPKIILEDFAFDAVTEYAATIARFANWLSEHAVYQGQEFAYIRTNLSQRLAVLPDDRFRDFVTLSTDVQTRISIDPDTGTVDQGPWNEEMLLPDTLLYNLVLGKKVTTKDKGAYLATEAITFVKAIVKKAGILQMGGDETLGRGLVRVRHLDGKGGRP
jgi:CRISPR-associated protein Cmr4